MTTLAEKPRAQAPRAEGPPASQAAEPTLITFGCRLNAYESEVMRAHAQAAGRGDAVIVNTCAVTTEAERQARQAIRRARRDNPKAEIIVTGCAAQVHPEAFAAMPEVSRVIGNQEKLRAESFACGDHPRVEVNDIMSARETAGHLIHGFAEKTRAFIEVQQGCDHRCTFCIIPYGRGPNRSTPVGEVVRQVGEVVAHGVREVVLTGVDITDYGQDLPGRPSLGALAQRILTNVPDLPRLRLSSVDPAELDGEAYRLLADEPRLMPHLHLSLQAGDDMILKRMKRRHSMADARACVERARAARPDVVFGADLIAGFPTETDAMFENTLRAVDTLDLTYLHVFPYSERPGTPAARMPQVPKAVRKARAARLRERGEAALARFLDSRLGAVERVLIEEEGRGRSEHFAEVTGLSGAPGEVVEATIARAAAGRLVAA